MTSVAAVTSLTFIRREAIVRTMNSTTTAVIGVNTVSAEVNHATGSVRYVSSV